MRSQIILLVAALSLASPSFARGKQHQQEERKDRMEKKADKLVSFSFHQSGGFMGVDRLYETKMASLSDKDREKLESLVAQTDMLRDREEQKLTRGAADMFHYEFKAVVNKREYKAIFDDGTLPASYRAIADYLKDKTTDLRRKG